MKIIEEFDNNNKILNFSPEQHNTNIVFKGKNNTLICEENVKLTNCYISFEGDDSIIYLSSNIHDYILQVSIYNNSVLFIGENCYINGRLHLILSESKNIFIGNNCLFSFDIWFRLADPHLIYDINSKQRINVSKSIYVGDHVWIGQEAMILKGTKIGSGSIIGAKSLVANKKIPSNSLWGGNPAKEIKQNIFYEGSVSHPFREGDTENSMINHNTDWIYEKTDNTLGFEYLESINDFEDLFYKIKFLVNLRKNDDKNRFYYNPNE